MEETKTRYDISDKEGIWSCLTSLEVTRDILRDKAIWILGK